MTFFNSFHDCFKSRLWTSSSMSSPPRNSCTMDHSTDRSMESLWDPPGTGYCQPVHGIFWETGHKLSSEEADQLVKIRGWHVCGMAPWEGWATDVPETPKPHPSEYSFHDESWKTRHSTISGRIEETRLVTWALGVKITHAHLPLPTR
jgi:hypothetical protein